MVGGFGHINIGLLCGQQIIVTLVFTDGLLCFYFQGSNTGGNISNTKVAYKNGKVNFKPSNLFSPA